MLVLVDGPLLTFNELDGSFNLIVPVCPAPETVPPPAIT